MLRFNRSPSGNDPVWINPAFVSSVSPSPYEGMTRIYELGHEGYWEIAELAESVAKRIGMQQ